MRSRLHAAAALLLLAISPLVVTSCYGRFPLTHAVYDFNGEIGNDAGNAEKWVESALFWVFVILPVYQLASLGDAIIFNVIEFWTGDTLRIGAAPGHGALAGVADPDGAARLAAAPQPGP
ncbi:MAG TPA: DUF3332 family protein [Candidatus Sumerlaeota bacterium]|nr:DUF3332 family protein [Candidatus Sumerlaeota bacterium]HPK03144.1 DUF3332 family protein [Candidatus Sumerlaeota bacterium]